MAPSAMASSTPVTVTVCGVVQLPVVKISDDPALTTPSVLSVEARERAAEAADLARERAAEAAEAAREAAEKAREAAGEAGRWARRQPQENPSTVVLVALAAGALIGALLPSCRRRA